MPPTRAPRPDLVTLLADAFAEARTLEANGASFSVDRVRTILTEIGEAAEPYTTRLSETDAAIRAGVSIDTMRGRFASMERDGNAWQVSRNVRQYRACCVPRRANVSRAAEAGRQAARSAREGGTGHGQRRGKVA